MKGADDGLYIQESLPWLPAATTEGMLFLAAVSTAMFKDLDFLRSSDKPITFLLCSFFDLPIR